MTPIVSRATEQDAEALSALNADVQAIHAAALPWRFKPPSAETFPPHAARALIASPENLVFIAHVGMEPAGYAYAQIMRRPETSSTFAFDIIYLHHISVQVALRRQGIGRALIASVREAGINIGITALAVDVWNFNESARLFFKRNSLTPFNVRLWSIPE